MDLIFFANLTNNLSNMGDFIHFTTNFYYPKIGQTRFIKTIKPIACYLYVQNLILEKYDEISKIVCR